MIPVRFLDLKPAPGPISRSGELQIGRTSLVFDGNCGASAAKRAL
jgi:hypothetical protein